ncbi:zinc finger CCCH domain-containing protein 19-like [Lolium rigidum]|uniref:zinc finger CCCH domain-containing protein 19-like n=1 Tax=Lolium rigidum TaxID=89674 RepID=UPI001F5D0D2E|nr:zinc finger CCCH domain-containing protein 19-like [Lolium rigidum]
MPVTANIVMEVDSGARPYSDSLCDGKSGLECLLKSVRYYSTSDDTFSACSATVGTKTVNSQSSDLGAVGAQAGAAQSNTQQFEDARNQSTDASNLAELMSTSDAARGDGESSGWSTPAQVANTSGQAHVAGNIDWGSPLQNIGWIAPNMPWEAPAQGATGYNMGWVTMPTQQNAVQNMDWVTPNPGNANMNMMWTTAQAQRTPNAAAMMGAQMQGVAMAPWGSARSQGNANSNPGWVPQVGNMNQNACWSAPMQGNPSPSPVNGTGQGSNIMNWNSPSGNQTWNNQQDFNGGNSDGWSWRPQSGGGGNGRCYKGEQCHFAHDQPVDGSAPRNDRRFDRQPSSNNRPQYDGQKDQHFDQQPSGSERHHDRNDNRERSWDDWE